MKKNIILYPALVVVLLSNTLFGQVSDTTTQASPPQLTRSGLSLTGYVEAYYVHDVTTPKTVQERPAFVYNHKRNREVALNLGLAKLAYTTARVRSNLAIQVGTYAQYNYATEQALVKNIYEANVGVKLSQTKSLWFDAGIFASHIGFESAISADCWTLTRSIMAENSPYYLAGAKLTYTTGKWTLLGMVTNGWQHIQKIPGYSGLSFSSQLQYQPSSELTLNWSTFIGSDRADSLKQGRFFNNVYAIINPVGKFGLILGVDIGADRKPVIRTGSPQRIDGGGYYIWFAPIVIARYKTSERSYVAGRIEYYDDKNAVLIGIPGFQTWGYSLNYDYALVANMLFRLEGKIYSSQTPIFEKTGGSTRTNASLTTCFTIRF